MIISPVPPSSEVELDPDVLARYKSGDAEEHLGAALASIRAWCGWHIAPTRTETVEVVLWPSAGVIPLPTMYLLNVAEVDADGRPVDPVPFWFTRNGLLRPTLPLYGTHPIDYAPDEGPRWFTITHGYPDLPADVLDVALRLATRSQMNPAGIGGEAAGPFSYSLGGATEGASSSGLPVREQSSLAAYRLPRVS